MKMRDLLLVILISSIVIVGVSAVTSACTHAADSQDYVVGGEIVSVNPLSYLIGPIALIIMAIITMIIVAAAVTDKLPIKITIEK